MKNKQIIFRLMLIEAKSRGFRPKSLMERLINLSIKTTLAELQTWIRDGGLKINANVYVTPFSHNETLDGTYSYYIYVDNEFVEDGVDFPSYEAALRVGISTVLNY